MIVTVNERCLIRRTSMRAIPALLTGTDLPSTVTCTRWIVMPFGAVTWIAIQYDCSAGTSAPAGV